MANRADGLYPSFFHHGRGGLANLFEILLDEGLLRQRNLVAVNLATGVGVIGLLLRPRSLELLLAVADLHHHLSADRG